MANTRVTEKKWCDVVNPSCTNPIYLAWQTTIGGVDYWLFQGDRGIEQESEITDTFDSYFTDLENTRSTEKVIKKNARLRYLLQADNLTEQQYEGILGVTRSHQVLMLTNPTTWETDGAKWAEVTVLPQRNRTNLQEERKTFTCTIELQPIRTQKR